MDWLFSFYVCYVCLFRIMDHMCHARTSRWCRPHVQKTVAKQTEFGRRMGTDMKHNKLTFESGNDQEIANISVDAIWLWPFHYGYTIREIAKPHQMNRQENDPASAADMLGQVGSSLTTAIYMLPPQVWQ